MFAFEFKKLYHLSMRIKIALFSLLFLLTPSTALAGGGLIDIYEVNYPGGRSPAKPGDFVNIKLRVHVSSGNEPYDGPDNRCKQCPVQIKFDLPRDSDRVEAPLKTDDNGELTAKVSSDVWGYRYIYAVANLSNGQTETSSKMTINFTGAAESPKPSLKPSIAPKAAASIKPAISSAVSSSQQPSAPVVVVSSEPQPGFFQVLMDWIKSLFKF